MLEDESERELEGRQRERARERERSEEGGERVDVLEKKLSAGSCKESCMRASNPGWR